MTINMNARGRKATFSTAFAIADALSKINSGDVMSRYLTLKLVDLGLVTATSVKGEGRGRPRVVYELTGKGRGRLALAKNWKRNAAA